MKMSIVFLNKLVLTHRPLWQESTLKKENSNDEINFMMTVHVKLDVLRHIQFLGNFKSTCKQF